MLTQPEKFKTLTEKSLAIIRARLARLEQDELVQSLGNEALLEQTLHELGQLPKPQEPGAGVISEATRRMTRASR